jgi:hypothetical protein
VWAERMGAVREGSGVRCVVNAFRSVFDPSFFFQTFLLKTCMGKKSRCFPNVDFRSADLY